ncbi:geranylgeranyl transferase type2 beta subunit, putative [Plasmodium sp. gorilla clade G2]|uniref:geranylgeranyl transferase type2 beta subunit, putative n=1 Tax=Plasmodium sp. gorilla clade G2 TaxID=880535 RepID=UPI000D20226D|nr:geranylgeranyl transferase type2 beta subunit, putative [Plasmodium sp. gorilla clade G2]SOV16709.1 geranylgeranyl transferase type2 beta subunit, putative [Plasmodium sp. gorilla clade G2]
MNLYLLLHEQYFINTIKKKLAVKEEETILTSKYESILLSAIFWVLSGISLINKKRESIDEILSKEFIEVIYMLVMKCLHRKKIKHEYIYKLKKERYILSNEDIKKKKKIIVSGFSPCNKKNVYEPNIISTLSAIQILFLLNKTDEDSISTKTLLEIYNFIVFLFDEEKGYFHFSLKSVHYKFDGDMRFMFCSLCTLYLLNKLFKERNIYVNNINNINHDKCIQWIINCFNIDGGFSNLPGSESHAGTTFCAIHSLKLLKNEKGKTYFSYNPIMKKKLIRWLCERYDNFGINGRVGKDHDVCYSWWVLSSLSSLNVNLGKVFNINIIINFILECQDKVNGGFSRIGQDEYNINKKCMNYFKNENLFFKQTDQFHSFFSLCALSLIYYNIHYYMKKERIKKNELFDHIIIPKHIDDVLSNMANIHEAFAMPRRLIK